jgi:hypothetical protein
MQRLEEEEMLDEIENLRKKTESLKYDIKQYNAVVSILD